jgi:hypothetical protein
MNVASYVLRNGVVHVIWSAIGYVGIAIYAGLVGLDGAGVVSHLLVAMTTWPLGALILFVPGLAVNGLVLLTVWLLSRRVARRRRVSIILGSSAWVLASPLIRGYGGVTALFDADPVGLAILGGVLGALFGAVIRLPRKTGL